jgi:glycosyltransferase involved in cell wall biosynthesis
MCLHRSHSRQPDSSILRVLILSQAPSQWQNPLFRFLERESGLKVDVIFSALTIPIDPELGHMPGWDETGFLGGFHWKVAPKGLVSLIKWAYGISRRRDLDVVVVPGWSIALARVTLLATIISRRARRRTVIFTDATDLTARTSPKAWVRGLALRATARAGLRFGAAGTAAREHLIRCGVQESKIIVTPYAVDNDQIAANVATWRRERDVLRRDIAGVTDPGAPIFLAVAKFVPREGPHRVIRSFLAGSSDFPEARLVIVGDGPDWAQLQELSNRTNGDRVLFAGYRPYSELPRFYAAADWFVHLPDLEPWGLSVNEATAAGLPLLCSTNVGSTRDLLKDGVNGILVGGSDGEADTAIRQALATSRQQLDQMSVASVRLSNAVHYRRWTEALRMVPLPSPHGELVHDCSSTSR